MQSYQQPSRIDPCPIRDAIFEIRFSSSVPADAIYGIAYSAVQGLFPGVAPIKLPIAQFPEQIRESDPNLKYQACHQLKYENLSISIGSRVLAFGNTMPYLGWCKWSEFFCEALSLIKSKEIIGQVERIGLRYINLFDYPILEKMNLDIAVRGNRLVGESASLRAELIDDEIVKILQVTNYSNVIIGNHENRCSIIDIDCIRGLNMNADKFFEQYMGLVNESHESEKELFFGLLKESFVAELNPIYGE